jgi:hypothetical protein
MWPSNIALHYITLHCITRANRLLQFSAIITVYCKNHKKHKHTMCTRYSSLKLQVGGISNSNSVL